MIDTWFGPAAVDMRLSVAGQVVTQLGEIEMYSLVLMATMATPATLPDCCWGRRGCAGGYGGGCSGRCYGGCDGGCHGGRWGGCDGGCYGGGYGGWSGGCYGGHAYYGGSCFGGHMGYGCTGSGCTGVV